MCQGEQFDTKEKSRGLLTYFAPWALLFQLPGDASDGTPCASRGHHHVHLSWLRVWERSVKSPMECWTESSLTPKNGLSSTKMHKLAEKGRVRLS